MELDEFSGGISSEKQLIWHGKMLGFFIQEKEGLTFITKRKTAHRLRIYDGFAMNEEVLKDLFQKNVKRIVVDIYDSNKKLFSSPENWIMKGIKFHSRKAEPQIALPEKMFDRVIE